MLSPPLYFGNVVQKFCSCAWYREDAIRDSKCTGSMRKHAGEFVSMKNNTWKLPPPADSA